MSETELVSSTETRVIDVRHLVDNPNNVNQMDDAQFNALCEGIRESGYVPTIDVAPLPNGRFLIVDGNHRKRAAVLLGYTELTCTVLIGLDDELLQEILSARIAVVRGTVNKTRFTQAWLKVRQVMDENRAKHVLGITSERQFLALVNTAKRRVDAKTVATDAVQVMMQRARVVDNLAAVIRAATGDGGLGEFNYLVFQVHGSELLLIRSKADDFATLKQMMTRIDALTVDHMETILRGLKMQLDEHGDLDEIGFEDLAE